MRMPVHPAWAALSRIGRRGSGRWCRRWDVPQSEQIPVPYRPCRNLISSPAASNTSIALNAGPAGMAGATTAFLQYSNQDSCHGFGKWRNLTRGIAGGGEESVGLLVPISIDEVVVDGAEASIAKHNPVIAAADRVSPPFIVDAPHILNLPDPVAAFALDQDRRLSSFHQDHHRPGLIYGS